MGNVEERHDTAGGLLFRIEKRPGAHEQIEALAVVAQEMHLNAANRFVAAKIGRRNLGFEARLLAPFQATPGARAASQSQRKYFLKSLSHRILAGEPVRGLAREDDATFGIADHNRFGRLIQNRARELFRGEGFGVPHRAGFDF